jgi:hypothetical protein
MPTRSGNSTANQNGPFPQNFESVEREKMLAKLLFQFWAKNVH